MGITIGVQDESVVSVHLTMSLDPLKLLSHLPLVPSLPRPTSNVY